jgi:hypothetical protein
MAFVERECSKNNYYLAQSAKPDPGLRYIILFDQAVSNPSKEKSISINQLIIQPL